MGGTAAAQLQAIYGEQEYPANTSTFDATTAWWEAQRALGDQDFTCPANYASEQLSKQGDVFQYFFTHTQSPSVPVVYHCADNRYASCTTVLTTGSVPLC
jgi:hypothetical protein